MTSEDFDVDAWLDDYEPYITSTTVCGKASLIAEHARLDQAWMAAKSQAADVMHDPAEAEAERALRECQARIEASERTYTFQSAGHKAWQDLKRKHPPSEDQRKEGLDTNVEEFSVAAIAACSLQPKVTETQARKMSDKLPPGEYEKLFKAVLEANGEVLGAPKSVLAVLTDRSRQNGGSSTTSPPGASHDESDSGTLADPVHDSTATTEGE